MSSDTAAGRSSRRILVIAAVVFAAAVMLAVPIFAAADTYADQKGRKFSDTNIPLVDGLSYLQNTKYPASDDKCIAAKLTRAPYPSGQMYIGDGTRNFQSTIAGNNSTDCLIYWNQDLGHRNWHARHSGMLHLVYLDAHVGNRSGMVLHTYNPTHSVLLKCNTDGRIFWGGTVVATGSNAWVK